MIRKFFNKNIIQIFFSAAVACVVGGFIWACFALRGIGTDTLIVHFNSVQGITHVEDFNFFIFMELFGLLVVLMNFAIAREFASRDRFLGRFLATITLAFAILLFIAFAAIISVNV